MTLSRLDDRKSDINVVQCDVYQYRRLKFYIVNFILYVLINVLATRKWHCPVSHLFHITVFMFFQFFLVAPLARCESRLKLSRFYPSVTE